MTHTILANWKMNPDSPKEAQILFDSIKNTVGRLRSISVIIAPPALFLHSLASCYKGNKVAFSAQKISIYESGSHTGNISAEQFANSGAQYALIGHSECNATLEDLRIQTFLSVKYSLIPIVFVGERQRDTYGKYLNAIKEQISSALKELSDNQIKDVILCYEPVWAIGAKEAMSAYDIHTMVLYIRKILAELYNTSLAQRVRILYGGSVNTGNIESILEIEDLDGVGVGRASTDMEQFKELLKIANRA